MTYWPDNVLDLAAELLSAGGEEIRDLIEFPRH